MKTSTYIMILLGLLVMIPIMSSVVAAQAPPFDRQLCLSSCPALRPEEGGAYGSYANFYNCVAACESQFWKEFDRNTKGFERKLNEPN